MPGTVSRALFGEACRAALAMGYEPGAGAPGTVADRVPLAEMLRLLDGLREASGDADIGLRLGRAINPKCFAITGYLVMAGPTLLQALPRIARYQRLVADGVALDVDDDGRHVRLAWRFDGVEPTAEFTDLLMAGVRAFGAWLLGTAPPLADVRFAYPQRASIDLHREIFGPGVRFGAGPSGFALERRWFEAPVCTANASIVPLLETYADQLLGLLRRDGGLAAISEVLLGMIPRGEVAIGAVAERLGRSPRSIQRTLQVNGTSFNGLVQEMRMRLANDYLARAELSLSEIAARLGYREQSSFCRAYRQWTGRSPGDARRAREG